MAKENTVQLYGWVNAVPKVNVREDENGNNQYVSGKLYLTTIRRSYATDDLFLKGNIRWDNQIVFSRNQNIISKKIASIKRGDMVLVRGTLCTKEVRKRYICPNCGHSNIKENGVVVYIDPICIHIFERDVPEETAYEILKSCDEFSNDLRIIGTLCRDPEYYEDSKNKRKECQFQIATNRLRRIPEDGPDKRTDYPWVKVFGEKAEECYSALHVNSSIYIGGAVQSRGVKKDVFCEACGYEFQRPEQTAEIIPYHVEYLSGCVLPVGQKEGLDEEE